MNVGTIDFVLLVFTNVWLLEPSQNFFKVVIKKYSVEDGLRTWVGLDSVTSGMPLYSTLWSPLKKVFLRLLWRPSEITSNKCTLKTTKLVKVSGPVSVTSGATGFTLEWGGGKTSLMKSNSFVLRLCSVIWPLRFFFLPCLSKVGCLFPAKKKHISL